MKDFKDNEKGKHGVLLRIRRLRGISHELRDIDPNRVSFWQREMLFEGFFIKCDELLDEAQFLLENYTETNGEMEESIKSLCQDVNNLEEDNALLHDELDYIRDERDELMEVIEEQRGRISKLEQLLENRVIDDV